MTYKNSKIFLAYTKKEYGFANEIKRERQCVYEASTLIAYVLCLRPNFKVIDVGSHFGIHSLKIASLIDEKKGGKQWTFEANPLSLQYVNYSISFNKFRDRVEIYNYAVFNQTKEIGFKLFYRGGQNAIGLLEQKRKKKRIFQRSDKENETLIKVQAITLDDFFPPQVLPEVNLIKIDIENAELMAIQGGKKLISRSKELIIIMEWWIQIYQILGEQYVDEQLQWLKDQGFHFWFLEDVKIEQFYTCQRLKKHWAYQNFTSFPFEKTSIEQLKEKGLNYKKRRIAFLDLLVTREETFKKYFT